MNLGPDEQESPASLARGTHNRQGAWIESSSGRKPSLLDPAEYIDAVLGSYRVLELLGKGGMGYVFRAEHVKLGREVALKLLRNDYASRRDAVARFFQEARTVNRVRHRNIVDVTDFVELDEGTTYIVMELLTGTSLGSWAHGGVDLPRALAVLVQICDGLGAAHEVGVIHRDLKPDNVIVMPTSDGAELVKLLDFGVAKLLNRDDEDVGFQTAAGSVIGTPAYMSPEQAGGMEIDARSDIYSLGAIMYELFSGQPMFRGRSFGEYVRKHLTEAPVPPSRTPGGAEIDPRLEAVILKCLDKDPAQRYANIFELREALLDLLGGMAAYPSLAGLSVSDLFPQGILRSVVSVPPRASAPLPPAPQPTSPGPAMSPTAPQPPPMFLTEQDFPTPARRSTGTTAPPWLWFVCGALAVGLGLGLAIWLGGRGDLDLAPRTPAASAPATAVPAVTQIPAANDPPASQPAPGSQPAPASNDPAASPTAPPAGDSAASPTAAPASDSSATRPSLVEVRFDSSPSGSVFADDRPVELCRTPCSFNIDLTDGGPTERRTFVVKRAGYIDSPVVVDLADARREFAVALQPARARPGARPREVDDARSDERRPKRRPARATRPSDKDGRDDAPRTPHDAKAPSADDEAPAGEPSPPRPAAKKSDVPAIDPADTLDPFRKK